MYMYPIETRQPKTSQGHPFKSLKGKPLDLNLAVVMVPFFPCRAYGLSLIVVFVFVPWLRATLTYVHYITIHYIAFTLHYMT